MQRRTFCLDIPAAAAVAALRRDTVLPFGRWLDRLGQGSERAVALAAIDAARAAGASYADTRVARVRTESLETRDRRVSSVESSETFGVGVRVLVDGAWGFAASRHVAVDEAAMLARAAAAQARANRRSVARAVELGRVRDRLVDREEQV